MVEQAFSHLRARERWGIVRAPDLDWRTASLNMYQGDFETAASQLAEMTQRNPGDLNARLQLARAYIRLQHMPAALAELEEVKNAPLRSESDGPRIHRARAEANALLGSLQATAGDARQRSSPT